MVSVKPKIQLSIDWSKICAFYVVFVLASCGQKVELPDAKPLSVSLESLKNIYGMQAGPYSFKSEEVVLNREQTELSLRLFYPTVNERFPLLIFSHGNWSDYLQYDRVINHWVSHGYVVIAPYHDDGGGMVRGIFNSLRFGQLGLIKNRSDDLKLILENLSSIEKLAPELKGKIERAKIAATGHSFGAFTAQQMLGAAAYNPDDDSWQFARDERIKAVVAISPPGPMFDVITADSWVNMQGPVLMTTGTWDINAQFWPEWQMHETSFASAVAGQQYSLVVDGADHYFGNLICRTDRDSQPQHNALAMVNASTLAFLDMTLKNRPEATQFMNSDQLKDITSEFASLKRR